MDTLFNILSSFDIHIFLTLFFWAILIYVTRYEKRDRSGFFADSAFLVWIISSTSIESNGAGLKEKFYSEAELQDFFVPGSPVAMK